MKKYLFLAISFIVVCFINTYSQSYKPVKSFKANYYKDYIYPGTIAPGIPDVDPTEISVVSGQWVGLNGENYPTNSYTPIEITTSAGTFTLNGVDADGTKHQFSGVRIILPKYVHGTSSASYLRANLKKYGGGSPHFTYSTQTNYDWYLTSGVNEMDLATGVTNVPTDAQISFGVILIDKDRIADGKPDFLFSQIAAPADAIDYYEFIDINGNIVGNSIEVKFNSGNIPVLGSWPDWDFHQGDNDNGTYDGIRPLRMITFDISDFGITDDEDENVATSYKNVAGLRYNPSGTADPAFIAADRLSLLAFKKLDATVSGEPTACQGEEEFVTFEVASEGGQGPYVFTYDIFVDGVVSTTNATVTGTTNALGNFADVKLPINTDNLGKITYKLKKVEDKGKNNSKEYDKQVYTVTIKDCSADYFVTTWKTTQDNETITIPTFPGSTVKYDYIIHWEGIDSSNSTKKGTEKNITEDKDLTFPTAGRYRVKIRKTFPYMYFNNSGDKDKILTVEQWGIIKWYSQENSYYGCKYLQISATDKPNLSEVTSFKNMFKDAYSVNSPNISTWETPKAKNMEGMFDEARSFNQNLASWDMSAVINVSNMFRNSNMSANKLGLTLAGWKTKLTNLSGNQTLGANLRYCNNGTAITITNLTMPTKQCATPEEVGEIYLETTNTANNRKRLAGILPTRAFEWLEEDVKVEGLTTGVPSEKGAFKLVEGTGTFGFNGVTLNIKKQIYSKNNVLRGFNSLTDEAIFPLANMSYTYKKEGSEDGFSFSEVVDSLPEKNLSEEGIIVYSNGHFYESIKVGADNKPNPSGTLKWVRIDN